MKNWIGAGSEKGQTEPPVRGDNGSFKMGPGSGQGQSFVSPASSASLTSSASSLLPLSTRKCLSSRNRRKSLHGKDDGAAYPQMKPALSQTLSPAESSLR
jgi:hypothetical protein